MKSEEIYSTLTTKFVENVLNNKNPFKASWDKLGGFAANAITGRPYDGMNQLLLGLGECDYESPFYLTYKQAQAAGGNVRKGEKGHKVTFWKLLESKTQTGANGKPKKIPMLKVYTVFNVSQCDNLELDLPAPERHDHAPIDQAQAIVELMPQPPEIHIKDGYARANYTPALDLVKMPEPSQFGDRESYHHVLFHELAHSTGHKKRLSREGITHDGVVLAGFGSEVYSKEELIAEMAASFCTARLGLFSDELEQSTLSYLRAWLKPLQDDPKAIAHAAGKAMKACRWIFGEYEAPSN